MGLNRQPGRPTQACSQEPRTALPGTGLPAAGRLTAIYGRVRLIGILFRRGNITWRTTTKKDSR